MESKRGKKKVLFICTFNSARSQIAEGLLRAIYAHDYEVYSAGTHPSTVHPFAINVMKEIGIDISSQSSKSIDIFKNEEIDCVVTVCDQAKEGCPVFPRAKYLIHKSFKDPETLIDSRGEILNMFRKVRDEIIDWIQESFKDPNALYGTMNKEKDNA